MNSISIILQELSSFFLCTIWLSMTVQTVWPSHSLSLSFSLTLPSFSHFPWKGRQTCQLWSRRCLRTRMMLVLPLKKKFINKYIYMYTWKQTTELATEFIDQAGIADIEEFERIDLDAFSESKFERHDIHIRRLHLPFYVHSAEIETM